LFVCQPATALNANDYFANLNGLPRTQLRLNRWGGVASGPVFIPKVFNGKDKLFWFLAYDGFHRNFPGTATATSPGAFFAAPTAATISTLATRLGITTTAAQTLYNNNLTGLASMTGSVPRKGDQTIVLPKLDWQINQKNKIGAYYNNKKREYTNAVTGTSHEALNTTYFFPFSDNLLTWSSPLTNKFLLEAGFWRHQETWGVRLGDTSFSDYSVSGHSQQRRQDHGEGQEAAGAR
jgi:hypothetical protein